jgi:hypothetical protein
VSGQLLTVKLGCRSWVTCLVNEGSEHNLRRAIVLRFSGIAVQPAIQNDTWEPFMHRNWQPPERGNLLQVRKAMQPLGPKGPQIEILIPPLTMHLRCYIDIAGTVHCRLELRISLAQVQYLHARPCRTADQRLGHAAGILLREDTECIQK